MESSDGSDNNRLSDGEEETNTSADEDINGSDGFLSDDTVDARSNEDKEFQQHLARHFIESGTQRTHVSKLLKILKQRKDLEFLPSDYRTLLKTPRVVKTRQIDGGHYFHFGFGDGISRSVYRLDSKIPLPKKLAIQINIDGVPLVNSSKSEFWPI